MTFLYLSCIEIALIYLLNIPKELFKRYIGMSLFVNGVVIFFIITGYFVSREFMFFLVLFIEKKDNRNFILSFFSIGC